MEGEDKPAPLMPGFRRIGIFLHGPEHSVKLLFIRRLMQLKAVSLEKIRISKELPIF